MWKFMPLFFLNLSKNKIFDKFKLLAVDALATFLYFPIVCTELSKLLPVPSYPGFEGNPIWRKSVKAIDSPDQDLLLYQELKGILPSSRNVVIRYHVADFFFRVRLTLYDGSKQEIASRLAKIL